LTIVNATMIFQRAAGWKNKKEPAGLTCDVAVKMCRKACESGVCPKCCDKCAWNYKIYVR
jgi:hypothetical protein